MSEGQKHRGEDLLAALVAFLVVFGVVYAVGRAAIPTFRTTVAERMAAQPSVAPAESAESSDVGSSALILSDLQVERASLEVPAIVQVDGQIEGRYAFGSAHAPVVWRPLQGERPEPGEGFPIDVDLRFTAADATLKLVADQVEVGIARSDGMTVIFTTDGQSFASRPGECTLELTSAGYDTATRPQVGLIIIPFFSGQVQCTEIGDLRTDNTVSFIAVFSYDFNH